MQFVPKKYPLKLKFSKIQPTVRQNLAVSCMVVLGSGARVHLKNARCPSARGRALELLQAN